MFLTILIVITSIIILMAIHEFGHFILAKKFGVRVDEFGIGYPPRIFGKKYGQTFYSLNLLPLGAFVKIYGDEADPFIQGESSKGKDPQSFNSKTVFQRSLILFGGVASFWIIAFILLSFVFATGTPKAISDDVQALGARVQITSVAAGSPAQKAGIIPGDIIIKVKSQKSKVKSIDKIKEVQEFIETAKGEEIVVVVQRGNDILDLTLTPRVSPPEGEGAMGVGLVRTVMMKYSWLEAPIRGAEAVLAITFLIIKGLYQAAEGLIFGLPSKAQVVGPIGLGTMMAQAVQLGLGYFLQFIATISIYLAVFNLLPIPALDGGRLLFLSFEKIKGRPINQRIEQKINTLFFFLLVGLMILVTIKDISRLL